MERAIKKTKDIRNTCYIFDDFVPDTWFLSTAPLNLKFEFIQSSQQRSWNCSLLSKISFISTKTLHVSEELDSLLCLSTIMLCLTHAIYWCRATVQLLGWSQSLVIPCYLGSNSPKCGWSARSQGWIPPALADSLQRHWGVSVLDSSGSCISLFGDLSAVYAPIFLLPVSTGVRASCRAGPDLGQTCWCALMPAAGVTQCRNRPELAEWCFSKNENRPTFVKAAPFAKTSLASFAFHTPDIFYF